MTPRSIWIGFDPREAAAFAVARESIKRHLSQPIPIFGLVLDDLRARGLYRRPTERRVNPETGASHLWDVISDAPMATEFSNSRFLVKELAGAGWAMFLDCDMLVMGDVAELFESADQSKAVMCVKHDHRPASGVKMDGQIQTAYPRKNWSSVFLLNCEAPANAALTVDLVNTLPGRDLHRFCWLQDDDIGALGSEWNWLVGHSDPFVKPKIVHHTDGLPFQPGYETVDYADEWRGALTRWAALG